MKRKKIIVGWIGVVISLIIASVWAYWGAFENFHEGWYSISLWKNLFMFVFQYMIFAIIFVVLSVLSLKWKRIGLGLHIMLSVFCLFFFSSANRWVLIPMMIIPLILLGFLYYYGDPQPKKWAYRIIILIPLMITLIISIPQGIKVAQRINDEDFGIRIVEGNSVTLAWAPEGPGWPDGGVTWEQAQVICKYLSADGTTIMTEEQNIWRLPTVVEAVSSMTLHNVNAQGVWDSTNQVANYQLTPDKETPIWNSHSKVIYYWTSDTLAEDDQRAYIIVYNGGVFDRLKSSTQDYLSFRAVKDVITSE